MARTHDIIQKHSKKAKDKQKDYYDKKAKTVKISVGDRVLVKKLAFEGKHKLADRFESETYVVIGQPRPDIPVLRMKSETSDRESTLHQNHLLRIGFQGETERWGEKENDVVPENIEKQESNKDAEKKEGMLQKDDVIEEEAQTSEDESDDDSVGYGYACEAFLYGDARKPVTVSGNRNIENDLVEVVDERETEQVEVDKTGTIEAPQTTCDMGDRVPTVVTGGNDADLSKDSEPKESVNGGKGNVENSEDKDMRKLETNSPEEGSQVKVDGGRSLEGIEEETEPKGVPYEDRERPTPPPRPPRRSARERKPPDKFSDYHMYSMVNQPLDRKVTALHSLMQSGILNTVDSEMAHKLNEAIMH